MPAFGKSRSSSWSAFFASVDLDSAISFQPFNRNRNGSVCCTCARSADVSRSAWNAGMPAMYSRMFRRDIVHDGSSTMNGIPAVRSRCASCISVVVFPRPAGPSRTMRPLCDNAWSICSSDSTSADSAPFRSSRTAASSMSGCPFAFRAQFSVTVEAARLVLAMSSATSGSASILRWRKLAQSEAFSGIIISAMMSSRSMRRSSRSWSFRIASSHCFRLELPTLAGVTKRSAFRSEKFSLARVASSETFFSVGVIEAASPLPNFSGVRLAGA